MTTDSQPKRLSPRTKRVREIVLTEGLRLFTEHGGAAVTALRISEATGVARSTIYRHWPDQASLLLDVIMRGVRPHATPQLTDHLEGDLVTALTGLRTRLDRRPFRAVFATLLEQANTDEAFAEHQRRLVEGVLQPVRELLEAAVDSQALPSTLDVEATSVALAGPLLVQHVMLRAPITDDLIRLVVQRLLAVEATEQLERG